MALFRLNSYFADYQQLSPLQGPDDWDFSQSLWLHVPENNAKLRKEIT
jgi:hypothetical protein